jgi:hypothetical protein
LDFCAEIDELKACSGKMAWLYSKKAIFGSGDESVLEDIILLNSIIRTLERNVPKYKKVTSSYSLIGQTVPFSALKKQNNTLILESTSGSSVTCVKLESCLSDDEICSVIEAGKRICQKCNF